MISQTADSSHHNFCLFIRERYQLREARRIRDLDRVLLGYQTYPQALTLVFDDLPGPDLLCHLTMDHFAVSGEGTPPRGGGASGGAEGEVQWCVFVPGADSRERLISLLARQWEALCSRELPVELTGWLAGEVQRSVRTDWQVELTCYIGYIWGRLV